MDTAHSRGELQLLKVSGKFRPRHCGMEGIGGHRGQAPRAGSWLSDHRARVHRRLVRVAHTESVPGPPAQRAGSARPSLARGGVHTTQPAWGSRDRLQATHKCFLSSLSWPTVISISA